MMAGYLRRHHWLAALGSGLVLLIVVSGSVGASDRLRIARPSDVSPANSAGGSIFAGIGRLGNDKDLDYSPASLGLPLRHTDGRSVAALATSDSHVSAVDVRFFPQLSAPPGAVGFHYISSVRYHLDGHLIYVITSEPTPAARSLQIILGETEIVLDHERTAYVSHDWERKNGDKSYRKEWTRISYTQEGLIVTIYGDLSQGELAKFAKDVALNK